MDLVSFEFGPDEIWISEQGCWASWAESAHEQVHHDVPGESESVKAKSGRLASGARPHGPASQGAELTSGK